MRRRQILLDEEASDRIRAGAVEGWLDQIEQANATALRQQKERSEKGFREGTLYRLGRGQTSFRP
jgi:hypothetical protein